MYSLSDQNGFRCFLNFALWTALAAFWGMGVIRSKISRKIIVHAHCKLLVLTGMCHLNNMQWVPDICHTTFLRLD